MTTKELLALVGKWRDGWHGPASNGYFSPPGSGARLALKSCADELAPIATALCAEVEAQNERIAQQDATIARMREALEKVSNYSTNKASEFEADFAKQYAEHDACPSCQEAKKRSWPPSGLCNDHYGPFHKLIDRRNNAVESDDKWGRVDIARAALAALNQEQVK